MQFEGGGTGLKDLAADASSTIDIADNGSASTTCP